MAEDFDFDDQHSILEYCLHRIDTSSITQAHKELFFNFVNAISKDMNDFNSTKTTCVIFGDKGHTFDYCPQLMNTDMRDTYIQLCVLANYFWHCLKMIDPSGKKHNNDLNAVIIFPCSNWILLNQWIRRQSFLQCSNSTIFYSHATYYCSYSAST